MINVQMFGMLKALLQYP